MSFKRIAFGYSSAEKERAEDPELLLSGYLDYKAATDLAKTGKKYLFLGYKGTGKSAIGERLALTLKAEHGSFVRLVSLGDFPFTPFSKIIRGDVEPEAKYPTAWSWLFLTYILESLSQDAALHHPDSIAFCDAVKAFRMMGLSPAGDPASLVRTSSKNNFSLALPGKLAEYSWSRSETRPASELPSFVESLKTMLSQARSPNNHFLIIDGLDDILTNREVQYRSLSALISEVARLNKLFSSARCPAKVVVLCRTDIFERLPGANKNKIRQDDALELDWYHDPRDPYASLLVEIAQLRASRSLGRSTDIFTDYFPRYIGHTETIQYLLDMTRHTPRDFLRLMTHIQEICGDGKITEGQVKSGLRDYSIKYFLPEIQDELSGYAAPDEISRLISALSKMRKRDFKIRELIDAAGSLVKPLAGERIFEICTALFDCGAIGNIQHQPGGTTFYTFKYRNRHSSFSESSDIVLHRGLWKALNLT